MTDDDLALEQFNRKLDTDPKYSLDVDPEGKYDMTATEKNFVKHYVNTRNLNLTADLCMIDNDTALMLFSKFDVQQEIRRLNMALVQRQFKSKMASLDDLGGFLTAMLTGENVPLADQLSSNEKLKVVDMLGRLHQLRHEAVEHPGQFVFSDIDQQVKNLSVETLKEMIKTNKKLKLTENPSITMQGMTPEECAYIKTLPTSEILKLVDEINKGGTQ